MPVVAERLFLIYGVMFIVWFTVLVFLSARY